MAGDASYANVSLLLHLDGANGSAVFTDSSPTPKTVSAVGSALISTAQSKFGGAALYLNGTTQSLSVPSSTAFDIAANEDFCIEGWVYRAVDPGAVYTMLLYRQEVGSTTLALQLRFSPTGKFEAIFRPNGSATVLTLSGATTVSIGVWHHVAVCRVAGTIRLFLNGVSEASAASTLAYTPGASQILTIGSIFDGSARSNYFNGYLDEIRWTKGVGRYSAGFTPSTSAFPGYAYAVGGIVKNDVGTPTARTVRAYRRDTGALVGSATSDATTGAYLIVCPTADEVDRIVLDDAAGTLYNDIVDRVIPG